MANLYEIAGAYAALEQLADNPETNDEQIEQWLVECGDALQEKAINVGKFIENLSATAEAIKEAEGRMAARRKVIENRVVSIKKYLLNGMQTADITKIECPFFKIARQKNPPSVVIEDEAKIDIQYWRQPETPPPAIDKRAILADMKEGVVVDGARLEQGERVVIK
jgi:hypothetical protein